MESTTPTGLNHSIEFNFRIQSGQPIADDRGFTLIHPDGSKEVGTLANGSFSRSGVPEGAYRMKFKYIEDCEWERSTAIGEPTVAMRVKTNGISAGTAVEFTVYKRFQTRLEPHCTVNGKVKDDNSNAAFTYTQKVGESPGGEFVFEARIGKKNASSGVLIIQRYPLDDIAGIQQRLKELEYYSGPVDGELGHATEDAVRAFQESIPELLVDGIPGPLTKREMEE